MVYIAAEKKTGATTMKKYWTTKLITSYGLPIGGRVERVRKAYPTSSKRAVTVQRIEKAYRRVWYRRNKCKTRAQAYRIRLRIARERAGI